MACHLANTLHEIASHHASYVKGLILGLIASFIHNDLTEVTFLRATIFKNVVYLDLSFNQMSIIRRKTYFILNSLIIIFLKDNPLKSVDLSKSHFSIMPSVVVLRYIDFSSGLSIAFSKDLSTNFHVKVSDLRICCVVKSSIKCTFNRLLARVCALTIV